MNIAITALVLFGVFAILLILGCPISVSIAISSIATTLVNLPWDQTSFIVMQKMNSGCGKLFPSCSPVIHTCG